MLVRQKKRVKIFNYCITGRHLWACSYVPHAESTKKHTNRLAHASSRFIQTYDSSKYWSGERLTCRTAYYTYDRCMLFLDTNKYITLSIKMILRIIVKNRQCYKNSFVLRYQEILMLLYSICTQDNSILG